MDSNNLTKKEQPKAYVLSELEQWLKEYEEFWEKLQQFNSQSNSGSNPPTPPPPPPGH